MAFTFNTYKALISTVTGYILLITVGVSVLGFYDNKTQKKAQLYPYLVANYNQWWRIFTHAFVHADYMHLGLNMFVLYNFGSQVEELFGMIFGIKGIYYYVLLYGGGLAFAALPSLARHKDNPMYRAVGASGAVSAVVFAFILLNPTDKLMLLILPFPMPAWLFGLGYLGLEYYLDKRGSDNVAHDAHFWGAMFGILFPILLKPSLFLYFVHSIIGS